MFKLNKNFSNNKSCLSTTSKLLIIKIICKLSNHFNSRKHNPPFCYNNLTYKFGICQKYGPVKISFIKNNYYNRHHI